MYAVPSRSCAFRLSRGLMLSGALIIAATGSLNAQTASTADQIKALQEQVKQLQRAIDAIQASQGAAQKTAQEAAQKTAQETAQKTAQETAQKTAQEEVQKSVHPGLAKAPTSRSTRLAARLRPTAISTSRSMRRRKVSATRPARAATSRSAMSVGCRLFRRTCPISACAASRRWGRACRSTSSISWKPRSTSLRPRVRPRPTAIKAMSSRAA